MVLNPDPRPGRWLLPLVILGMMAFTYVFVQNLPASENDAQGIGADGAAETVATTTTTTADTATTQTTVPAVPLSPEAQQFIDQVSAAETDLLGFQAEMNDINARWDGDPRTLEYQEGEALLTDLAQRMDTWATNLSAIVPPVSLSEDQTALVAFAGAAADAADAVLAGFTGPTAEPRLQALEEFGAAVTAFTGAVDDIELRATTTGA